MEIRNRENKVLFVNDADAVSSGDLDDVDLTGAQMAGFSLEGLVLSGTMMRNADLSDVDFYWGSMLEVDLSGANLERANLQGCSILRSNLHHANLRRANLGPSNLGGPSTIIGSDFRWADLTDAIFASAIYDDSTLFPDGFDPVANGLIHSRDYDSRARYPAASGLS